MIDTHCHLDFEQFDADRSAVIGRFPAAGVEKVINVGTDLEGSRRSAGLADSYPAIFAAAGIHPHYAASVDVNAMDELRRLAGREKVLAIGEIGLDYYRDRSPRGVQMEAFAALLDLSLKLKLPAIVHCREADEDMIRILKGAGAGLRGVMHCFSGGAGLLSACLGMGLCISFTGNITFKNASRLRDIVSEVPMERLLLETDAPYMAPQALRGRRCEPAYVKYVAAQIAEIKGMGVEEVDRITTANCKALFEI